MCQLDAIGKCSKLDVLQKMLRSLPKSLEETYERILTNIETENRHDAIKLLHWAAFSARPVSRINPSRRMLAIADITRWVFPLIFF